MKTIWKWMIPVSGEVTIQAPEGANFVETVRSPYAMHIELWAEVETTRPLVEHRFAIVGTGHPMPSGMLFRLGAAFDGQFVWHVYEVRS